LHVAEDDATLEAVRAILGRANGADARDAN
jgi:hypothetical protein